MLQALHTRDDPAVWAALGFAAPVRVGPVAITCDGGSGWTLTGEDAGDVDGIPTRWAPPAGDVVPGERELDHVVVLTDSLDRTVDALVAVGGDERRRIDIGRGRMAFVRLGVILEVVERAEVEAPHIWGLVAVVDDLAGLPADLVGSPKDAVQPGRRIVTVRPMAGLDTAVAFMTPRVRAHR